MKRLAYLFLPLLFLPNAGLAQQTRFGSLQLADFAMFPYLIVVTLAYLKHRPTVWPLSDHERRILLLVAAFFLSWATVSTLTIGTRYPYVTDYQLEFGLLKLGKLLLYCLAAWLTASLTNRFQDLRMLLWALAVGGLILAISFVVFSASPESLAHDSRLGYEASNSASVQIAILIVFLGAAWVVGWGSAWWRRFVPWALAGTVLGAAFSQGRGGWVAAVSGLSWFAFRRGLSRRALVLTAVVIAIFIVAYLEVPVFRVEVDRTLMPDPLLEYQYSAEFMGVDVGSRPALWLREGRKLIDSPLLGRGFFNRSVLSGLHKDGSHNFWLQMFLETGVPGGLSVVAMVVLLFFTARRLGLLPTEAALLTAVVGGMGGEYFYGGMTVFTLLLTCSPFWLQIGASRRLRPEQSQRRSS